MQRYSAFDGGPASSPANQRLHTPETAGVIYDCMIGDAILFQRADGVEAGWRIVQPFLDAWRNAGAEGLASYQAGTPGPAEAERLIMQNGRAWRSLTEGC